jgi:hypothetical protein
MSPGSVGGMLDPYSGFVPGLVVSLIVSLGLAARVGRRLGVRPILGFALLMSIGVVASATLTPSHDALLQGAVGTGTCDLSRVALASRAQLRWPAEPLLNILLFIPLGASIGLWPASPARTKLAALALAWPLATELLQLIAIPLGRECQSGDIIDNLTGLSLGILGATLARWIIAAGRQSASAATRRRTWLAALAALVGVAIVGAQLLSSAPVPSPIAPPGPGPAVTRAPVGDTLVRVASVPALLDALADDAVDEIVVADGIYRVSKAADRAEDSLWIGARFAGRSDPVTVRAETTGGVTFDGGGASGFEGLVFAEGAHDQTWAGFVFAHGTPTNTGVIVFGDATGSAAPHHITLRDITIPRSITSSDPAPDDHAVFFGPALGGPHDLLIDGLTVDGAGGLGTALSFYRSDASHRNAWNVTVRRLRVSETQQAIVLWDRTLHDITIDNAVITDALEYAMRYESPDEPTGPSGIVIANVTSTGSGSGKGFYSSLGPRPAGVTFINSSLR